MSEVKEAIGFPGYYEIPGFSKYAISPDGILINKLYNGRAVSGGPNPDGYHNFRINGDDGHTLTWGRHRLLAFVFLHPGIDITNLVVNHKNAIKGDDFLDNLEWMTYQENQEHAGMMGLTIKCQPVAIRDIDTGVIRKYPSIVECARALGVSKDTVNWRVKMGDSRVFPDRKQYRLTHQDVPWHIPLNTHRDFIANGTSKRILMKNVLTDEISQFEQATELAIFLKISPSTVTLWVNQENQPVLPGLIQIKWVTDLSPWRIVLDAYKELDQYAGTKCVRVLNHCSGEIKMFTSALECAKTMKLKTTALNYRLKSKGNTVFSDGCSYSYYSDYLLFRI